MLFIAFTLVAGIVAVNSGNNLLFILVAALLGLLSLSGILAFLNISGLSLSLRTPEEVFAAFEEEPQAAADSYRKGIMLVTENEAAYPLRRTY